MTPDRAMGEGESMDLARALDDDRIAAVGAALRRLHRHDAGARSTSWAGALRGLERVADALEVIERARVDLAILEALLPHVALSAIGEVRADTSGTRVP